MLKILSIYIRYKNNNNKKKSVYITIYYQSDSINCHLKIAPISKIQSSNMNYIKNYRKQQNI